MPIAKTLSLNSFDTSQLITGSLFIDRGKVTHIPYTMVIHSKHEVKPEYEDMAKREWC